MAGEERESWTIEHFSLSNPQGPGQDDVPALLRRIAGALESRGAVQVQDVVFHGDVEDAADWPTMTLYFHRTEGTA